MSKLDEAFWNNVYREKSREFTKEFDEDLYKKLRVSKLYISRRRELAEAEKKLKSKFGKRIERMEAKSKELKKAYVEHIRYAKALHESVKKELLLGKFNWTGPYELDYAADDDTPNLVRKEFRVVNFQKMKELRVRCRGLSKAERDAAVKEFKATDFIQMAIDNVTKKYESGELK